MQSAVILEIIGLKDTCTYSMESKCIFFSTHETYKQPHISSRPKVCTIISSSCFRHKSDIFVSTKIKDNGGILKNF